MVDQKNTDRVGKEIHNKTVPQEKFNLFAEKIP